MASRNQIYAIGAISFALGVLQLVLAWRGLLLWDAQWLRPTDHAIVPWFGYITNFHWWVPYVTTVPVMIACSLYGLTSLWQLSSDSRTCRRALVVAASAAATLAIALVAHEVIRSATVLPDSWAQWNDMLAEPSNHAWSPQYRAALHLMGYTHYLVAYVMSVACVIGALAFAITYRAPQSPATRAAVRRRLLDVILSLKIIVVGYLFFLVLLRSSKVGMWLQFRHQAVEFTRIYEFVKDARPYFEVAREGVLADLILGLFWCVVCFLVCILLSPTAMAREVSDDLPLSGVGLRVTLAYSLIGRFWFGLFGLCILGIVLPPPSGWHFIAVCGTLIGGYLVARAFRGAEPSAG